jgi:hypothetical protein
MIFFYFGPEQTAPKRRLVWEFVPPGEVPLGKSFLEGIEFLLLNFLDCLPGRFPFAEGVVGCLFALVTFNLIVITFFLFSPIIGFVVEFAGSPHMADGGRT